MKEMSHYEYEELLNHGKVEEFLTLVQEDFEVLALTQEFSRFDSLLRRFWDSYPQIMRKTLLEMLSGEQAGELAHLLEVTSISFEFHWNEAECNVAGNFLFSAVWKGEYELVEALVKAGMDPDGTSRNIYVTKADHMLAPLNRWGKMKCSAEEESFFGAFGWRADPWGALDPEENEYLITPLFLAELMKDERMVRILKDAGACEMPSREKMWENARPPKNSDSAFGNV